jgi:4-hydroxy-tetrahydrodipicolinate reductase
VTTKVAILGTGKMGAQLAALAPESGCTVVAHLGEKETESGLTLGALNGAEVVIEFTVPTAAPSLVRTCAALGVPVVSGTTGWDAQRADVEAAVKASSGALLWAPNFSLGVHLFSKLVAVAAKQLSKGTAGFDVRIVETHHTQKLDAPSGTAKMLAKVAERERGETVPIESIRTGTVPGTHELIFDARFEQVRIVHEAKDRKVFAAGALSAARWLKGRRGVYTMDDFLGGVS